MDSYGGKTPRSQPSAVPDAKRMGNALPEPGFDGNGVKCNSFQATRLELVFRNRRDSGYKPNKGPRNGGSRAGIGSVAFLHCRGRRKDCLVVATAHLGCGEVDSQGHRCRVSGIFCLAFREQSTHTRLRIMNGEKNVDKFPRYGSLTEAGLGYVLRGSLEVYLPPGYFS